MKRNLFCYIFICLTFFTSCNNSNPSSKDTPASKMDNDTSMKMPAMQGQQDSNIITITPSFSNLDTKLSTEIKIIIDDYLHIKNALINNDGEDAAGGGKAMKDALSKVEQSLFTKDQKKIYNDIADDLEEHAEHIGKNSADVKHQREHFSMLSEDMHDLTKAFGGGRVLYYDHCPMVNEDKGASWLSEMKEVKNPYFSGKMNDCVKVQEVIR